MSGEEKKARRMSRREFVCLGAGVALGGALGGAATYLLAPRKVPEEERTFDGRGATEVKITVLKCPSTEDIVLPVKSTDRGGCPVFYEGEEFTVDAERPQIERGFCSYAWDAIFPRVWEWYEQERLAGFTGDPRVGVTVCPDGFRPVIFMLEWI